MNHTQVLTPFCMFPETTCLGLPATVYFHCFGFLVVQELAYPPEG